MSRTVNTILTVTIVIFMAGLLLYGYCATQKLDEKRQDVKVVSSISKHINYRESPPAKTDQIEANEDDGISETDEFETYIEENDDEFVEEVVEEKPVEAPQAAVKNITPPQPSEAAFMVIAGSFKNLENAKNKIKLLEQKGIEAEIVHLKNSPLHAISVGIASSEKEANDLMTALKSKHKIKAYVYKNPQKNN